MKAFPFLHFQPGRFPLNVIGHAKIATQWWFWLCVPLLFVLVVQGYLLIPLGQPRISGAACDKIELGMQAAEVGRLLGFDYTESDTWIGGRVIITGQCAWGDEDGNCIEVTFDKNSVTGKNFTPTELSFFERMIRRVERRIRAIWP